MEACWVKMFNDARILCCLTLCDMESYMHVHVAASMPLLTLCYMAHKRVAGIFWTEARKHAKVLVPSNSVNFWTCAACMARQIVTIKTRASCAIPDVSCHPK